MSAQVLSYEGKADGLRFGYVRFPGNVRRWFVHDRIADHVTLWRAINDISKASFEERPAYEDHNPDRKSAALQAMRGRG